jgi:hypothetical protein
MLEDLRKNHDARPNAQERAWMSFDPMSVAVKLVALAGFAVAVGVTATHLAAPPQQATTVAAVPE